MPGPRSLRRPPPPFEGDPALRAETTHLWGRIEAGRGAFRRAARILEDGAALAAATSLAGGAHALRRRHPMGATGGARARRQRRAALVGAALAAGRTLPSSRSRSCSPACSASLRPFLQRALELWRRAADVPVEGDADALARIAEALFSAGDDEPARMAAERAIARARESSALESPVALGVLALIEMRAGKLRTAAAAAAGEQARTRARPAGRVRRSRSAGMDRGRCSVVTRNAAGTTPRRPSCCGKSGTKGPSSSAVGLLGLSLDRPQEAIEELERTVRFRGVRMRGDVLAPRPVLADLIEAVRAGRLEDARQLAGPCANRPAVPSPSPWRRQPAVAVSSRARSSPSSRRSRGTSNGRTSWSGGGRCSASASSCAEGSTTNRCPREATRRAGRLRGGRCHDLGRAGPHRAAGDGERAHRRSPSTATRSRPRSFKSPAWSLRGSRAGDRRQALSQPQDDRDPPPPRIPKARRALPNGACSLVRARRARCLRVPPDSEPVAAS